MAERKAASDPHTAARLRQAAIDQARQGISDLRDLAAGIHPGILTDRGLVAAVEALASRLPLPVSVTHDLPRRLSAPVEASVYFLLSEALTNVGKHAHAHEAHVAIRSEADRLVVEIGDDGVGGATTASGGTGLAGLHDRVVALDGELTVTSPPGQGTILHAEIPLG
jgi:signal transduction histidine kinase